MTIERAVINIKAISFEKILVELQTYVESQDDADRWLDFFEGGAGQTLLELMSGLGTYLSYHSSSARREAYLDHAKLRSSIFGIATMQGYPVERKSAPLVFLKILNADPLPLVWAEDDLTHVVSTYSPEGLSMVAAIQFSIPPGESRWVPFYIGNWVVAQREFTTPTAFQRWRFDTDQIQSDVENLTLNPGLGDIELIPNAARAGFEDNERRMFLTVENIATVQNLDLVKFTEDMILNFPLLTPETFVATPTIDSQPIPSGLEFLVNITGDYSQINPSATALTAGDHVISTIPGTFFPAGSQLTLSLTSINRVVHGVIESQRVLVRTTIDGATLVFGDGAIGYKIEIGDLIQLRYILSSGRILNQDVLAAMFSLGDFSVGGTGFPGILTLQDASFDPLTTDPLTTIVTNEGIGNLGSRGKDEAEKEKVRFETPAYFASRRRMITIPDHIAIFLTFSGNMISANARRLDDGCCTVEMPYLLGIRDTDTGEVTSIDPIPANPVTIQNMLTFLDEFKPIGEQILILDPVDVKLDLTLTVVLNRNANVVTIQDDIRILVKSEMYVLGKTFRIGEVIARIGKIKGVERVYIKSPSNDRPQRFEEFVSLENLGLTLILDSEDIQVDFDPVPYVGYTARPLFTGVFTFNGTVGIAFSETVTAVYSPPITFAIAPANSLPAGLVISAGGAITGTPTASGTTTTNLIATNAQGDSAETPFTFIIAP